MSIRFPREKSEFEKKGEIWFDDLTLKVCAPFEHKAAEIRYKRLDPEGFEADCIISESFKLVVMYEKKERALRSSETQLLIRIHTALTMIQEQKKGRRITEVAPLLSRTEKLLPTQVMKSITGIDKIVNEFTEKMCSTEDLSKLIEQLPIPLPAIA